MSLAKYIGIPFVDQGRSFEGSDCYGVIWLFYKHEKGITLPMLNQYESTAQSGKIAQIIQREKPLWKRVYRPEYGDVIVFVIGGIERHVGVYIGDEKFIHGFQSSDSCVEALGSSVWKNRVGGFFRYG